MNRPWMRNKLIVAQEVDYFESKMDKFIENLDNYSIQYKPVCENSIGVWYTALITYEDYRKDEDDEE